MRQQRARKKTALSGFDIWIEGWSATGGHSGAHKLGTASGETFLDACHNFFLEHPSDTYDPETNRDWACNLFDNEADARKSFG